jgi:prolipoprotein diacylglyceryl transferase
MSAGNLSASVLASIPSPTQSVWHLGPVPIRAYALCIVLGILVAIAITERRWKARGGQDDQIGDLAAWGVVFGIIGGRLYHVITTPDPYFGTGGHPINALKIYEGGLGIWGAVALGSLGVWIATRRKRLRFAAFADAAAPGLVLAQAIGRWGNYFNNELYGRTTSLPWKLAIHDVSVDTGKATVDANGHAIVLGYYHPTFLYESIWCVLVALALLAVDQRYRMGRGRLFALYAVLYSFGRFWIESLRIDEAHHLWGLRLNEWTSLAVMIGGIAWIVTHRGPREISVSLDDPLPGAAPEQDADGSRDGDADEDGDAIENDGAAAQPSEPARAVRETGSR